jgi:hypothetical protein
VNYSQEGLASLLVLLACMGIHTITHTLPRKAPQLVLCGSPPQPVPSEPMSEPRH